MGTGYWLFCLATGAHKPISWQVNSSCTASLYLFLKGLFETERVKERERKTNRREMMRRHTVLTWMCTAMKTICLPLNVSIRRARNQMLEPTVMLKAWRDISILRDELVSIIYRKEHVCINSYTHTFICQSQSCLFMDQLSIQTPLKSKVVSSTTAARIGK